jgi:hypothetical protein
MQAITTLSIRVYDAINLFQGINSGLSNIYLSIGKVRPWSNEPIPDIPIDCVRQKNDFFYNIFNVKKIDTINNASLGIRRYNWTTGTLYRRYDDTTDMFNSVDGIPPFYVLTTDMAVYKCIDNNFNGPSWVMPFGTSLYTVKFADGYVWKYMFSLSPSDQLKFLTPQFIPIKFLTTDNNTSQFQVQNTATPGTVDSLVVGNSGSGYTVPPNVIISGDGVGATALAVISGGIVTKILVTNTGYGYTYASVIIDGNASNIRAIISPPAGHGANSCYELGGYFLIVYCELNDTESGIFPIGISFRQLGLISNPTLYATKTTATGLKYAQYVSYQLGSVTGTINSGDQVISGSNSAYILDFNVNTSIIRLINVKGALSISDTLVIGNNTAHITGVIKPSYDLNYASGDILYMENIKPLSRNSTETQGLKIVFEN